MYEWTKMKGTIFVEAEPNKYLVALQESFPLSCTTRATDKAIMNDMYDLVIHIIYLYINGNSTSSDKPQHDMSTKM